MAKWPEVQFYDVGRGRANQMLVMNKIEANQEWAYVHDLDEDRWEIWVDGENADTVFSWSEAQKSMKRFLALHGFS